MYGGAEQIHTMVRKGLKEDMPAVYRFLDQFQWTAEDMAQVMVDIQGGMSPEDAAKVWVSEHENQVNSWIAGIE
ncbi:glycine betaine ABC transporter substrate-binding protein [Paenibacillus sp. P3E]